MSTQGRTQIPALVLQQRADGNAVIRLSGRLDAETCDTIEPALDLALAQSSGHLVFDLAQVEYISSAGVRLLIKARNHRRRQDRQVVAAFANPQALRVFDAVGKLALDALLKDQSAVDSYLATLSGGNQ